MYFIRTGSNFLMIFFLALFLAVVMPEGLPWANSLNENKHWSSLKAHLGAVLCNLAVWSLSRSTGWPQIRTWAYMNEIITRSKLISIAYPITRNIKLIASGQPRFTSWVLLGGGKWNNIIRGFRWGCYRSSQLVISWACALIFPLSLSPTQGKAWIKTCIWKVHEPPTWWLDLVCTEVEMLTICAY